jgi:riboflavin transporter FmnP
LGDVAECDQGSCFLADFGWLVGGMLLGLLVGIVVPVTLALRRSFLLVVPVLVAVGAVPSVIIVGVIVGIGWFFRHQRRA